MLNVERVQVLFSQNSILSKFNNILNQSSSEGQNHYNIRITQFLTFLRNCLVYRSGVGTTESYLPVKINVYSKLPYNKYVVTVLKLLVVNVETHPAPNTNSLLGVALHQPTTKLYRNIICFQITIIMMNLFSIHCTIFAIYMQCITEF